MFEMYYLFAQNKTEYTDFTYLPLWFGKTDNWRKVWIGIL